MVYLFKSSFVLPKKKNMIADFLKPINKLLLDKIETKEGNWKSKIHFYEGQSFDYSAYDIAILGVNEGRGNSKNKGTETAADTIRKSLYSLFNMPSKVRIIDLGNIEKGQKQSDTTIALSSVVNELLRNKILPIILGGDQTLALGQYKGYNDLDFFVNMVSLDERFTISDSSKKSQVSNENYLFKLFTDPPNILFNFSQLGYQTYFVPNEFLDLMHKMQFDSYRLGIVREDLREFEPVVRDADLMVFNIGSLRQCDAPGISNPSPNGFFADEACQLFRYAGLSDRLSSLGIYDFNPDYDLNNTTAIAIAQMIWYFIDGYSQRKGDYPIVNENDFNKFIVPIEDNPEDLVFLSKKSDRWWIKIEMETKRNKKHKLFPCTIKDYHIALENEIPERWMRAYNKIL